MFHDTFLHPTTPRRTGDDTLDAPLLLTVFTMSPRKPSAEAVAEEEDQYGALQQAEDLDQKYDNGLTERV